MIRFRVPIRDNVSVSDYWHVLDLLNVGDSDDGGYAREEEEEVMMRESFHPLRWRH